MGVLDNLLSHGFKKGELANVGASSSLRFGKSGVSRLHMLLEAYKMGTPILFITTEITHIPTCESRRRGCKMLKENT